MNAPDRLGDLRVNPDWDKLRLFDRKGWRRMKFGDFADSINERVEPADAADEPYVGLDDLDSGDLHIRRWGKGSDVIGTKLRFRKGDVIFGRRRAYQRKLAVAEFDGICSAHAMVLRAKPELILPEMLPFLMISDRFMKRAVEISVGSLSPTINWTTLKLEAFNLPLLEQQPRLVKTLDAARRALDHYRASAAESEKLREVMLNDLYRRGLGHTSFKTSPLGHRPSSWEVVPLQEHYDVQLGKMMSPKAMKGASHRPYLRNANVQWNRLDLSDVATMSFTDEEAEKFSLRVGDILACEGRHVGKSAIWRNEISGACYQKALHRIRARDSEQVPEFLLYQMEHHSRAGIFAEEVGETTIPHLPAERLRQIPFAFPPRHEQLAIAEEMAKLDAAGSAFAFVSQNLARFLAAAADRVFGNELY